MPVNQPFNRYVHFNNPSPVIDLFLSYYIITIVRHLTVVAAADGLEVSDRCRYSKLIYL